MELSLLPTSRAEAKRLGLPHFNTGKPCKYGHFADRRTENSDCVECNRGRRAEWERLDPEKAHASDAKYRASHQNEIKAERRRFRAAHLQQLKLEAHEFYLAHQDEIKAKSKKFRETHPIEVALYQTAWRHSNRGKASLKAKGHRYRATHGPQILAHVRARQASRCKAMPPWVNPKDFVAFYKEAQLRRFETGLPWEVDHIEPLRPREKNRCGLHVPGNLQVILRGDNRRKHNS